MEKNPEILDVSPWRFCGEYFGREADALYLRARHYDSATLRMLSEDGIRSFSRALPNGQKVVDPASLNLYTYCYNNPIRYLDPTGYSVWDTLKSFGGGIIAGVGEAMSYGITEHIADALNPAPPPDGVVYQIGKIVGNVGAGNGGVITFTGGAAGGIVTAPTGVGAVAGVGVAVYGSTVAVSGGVAAIKNKAALVASLGGSGGHKIELPDNTIHAGKPGSPEWKAAVRAIKEGKGKGINIETYTQDDAQRLLREARPDLPEMDMYTTEQYKFGYEIHPAEPDVGNGLSHIKWKDWSSGKSSGANGHIFFGR